MPRLTSICTSDVNSVHKHLTCCLKSVRLQALTVERCTPALALLLHSGMSKLQQSPGSAAQTIPSAHLCLGGCLAWLQGLKLMTLSRSFMQRVPCLSKQVATFSSGSMHCRSCVLRAAKLGLMAQRTL